ncbi:MAG: hypothetical protein QXG98_02585 [Candidatus Micrarchaeia archaeon]
MAVLVFFLLFSGCSSQREIKIQELVLGEQDLQQLGMAREGDCQTEEYQASAYSPMTQHTICNYTINSLNNTRVVLELKSFASFEELNNAYQYESSHLFGAKGLLSENELGDRSRFRVNSEDDFGASYNPPGVYYYHLWICKNKYLIHVTSSGDRVAGEFVKEIGKRVLTKLE